jgi:hypothetical protein
MLFRMSTHQKYDIFQAVHILDGRVYGYIVGNETGLHPEPLTGLCNFTVKMLDIWKMI